MIENRRVSGLPFRVPSFGENLKRLRDAAGMTQEQLAKGLKMKRPTPISLWEGPRKKQVPKPATLVRIAEALGVGPWELLEDVETDYDKLRKGVTGSVTAARTNLGHDETGMETATPRGKAAHAPTRVQQSLAAAQQENDRLRTLLREARTTVKLADNILARGSETAADLHMAQQAPAHRKSHRGRR